MKSLSVITTLPLTSTSDKVDQLTLTDENLLVPIDVFRSAVANSLPLTEVLGRTLLTPQQTKERFGPWLKMYEFLDIYDISLSYHKGPQDKELALAMFTMLSNFSCGSELRAVEVFLDERRLQHGPTLMNCKSEDDVKELGIALTAKARILYEEIDKFKSTGVPLTLLSEVNEYLYFILSQKCFILIKVIIISRLLSVITVFD